MFENVETATYAIQLVIAFGAGVISFVSPCVLPLLPGYLSMMSGYSASELEEGNVSTPRMVRVILLFIAGFTVVFVVLGVAAASLGNVLTRNLGTFERIAGVIIIAFGLLMVAMAISNRGFLANFNRERRVDVRPSRLGGWAPPVMGAAFGFGWTPCIGPVLTVILATAGTRGSVPEGIGLLVSYSLGLGVPFLLAGLGLFKLFGKLKPYLRGINFASGLILASFGVLMVMGRVGDLSVVIVRFFDSVPFLRDLSRI
jgi:cytochrome c-type biogenesis protein